MTTKKIQKRRGLSSIVGALLFVVLMVAAFAVLGVALDSQTDIVDTGRVVADSGLKKQQEKFKVDTIVQLPGDSLQVNITNLAQNPTEIFTLVITNSSDITDGYPTQTIDIPSDTSFIAPNSDKPTDIVKTLNLKMANTPDPELYNFKVISSLGTIQQLYVVCQSGTCGLGGGGGSSDLFAQFLMDGPNAVNTKTSTAVMFVTNTGQVPLTDVAPDIACSKGAMFSVVPDTAGTADYNPCTLDPTTVDLEVGQTAIFKWDGTVTGEINDVFTFCNQATGTDPDLNSVSSSLVCDDLTVIDPNDCGGCGPGGEGGETIILLDDLLIRPSLFLTMPGPYGNTGSSSNENLGVWGVNVANPTNSTMEVSKVTITAFAPGANNNVRIFDATTGNPVGTNHCISPNGPCSLGDLGDWSLDDENVMVWRNFASPIILPPYSTESFLIKAKPFTNGANLESIIVQTSVFTTSGSFGKAAYQTTMFSDTVSTTPAPIANVYLSNQPDSRDSADILGHFDNLKNGTKISKFSIVLADMDENSATYIKSGARLIVNVPREWTFNEWYGGNTTGFVTNALPEPNDEPSVRVHGDGSTQIIATTNVNIGDYDATTNPTGVNTATLSFAATTPEKTNERMYIMYVLADGLTEEDKSVGPLSEVLLHVIGNVTGYP